MRWTPDEIVYARKHFELQLYGDGLFMSSINATQLLSHSVAALIRAGLDKDPMAVQICSKLNQNQPWILQIVRTLNENDEGHPLYPAWARRTALKRLTK